MCRVPGCARCFARGEHLKRHIRCLHTNEKREFPPIPIPSSWLGLAMQRLTRGDTTAFACDFPGCEKEFSRQDNLHQHMRVHKGYASKAYP